MPKDFAMEPRKKHRDSHTPEKKIRGDSIVKLKEDCDIGVVNSDQGPTTSVITSPQLS